MNSAVLHMHCTLNGMSELDICTGCGCDAAIALSLSCISLSIVFGVVSRWLFPAQVALQVSTDDADEGCRTAARELLANAPLTAAALVPLLALPPHAAPAKRGRTGGKAAKAANEASEAGQSRGSMSLLTAALELLQWRADVAGAEALTKHLSSLLQPLLSIATQEPSAPAPGDEDSADE